MVWCKTVEYLGEFCSTDKTSHIGGRLRANRPYTHAIFSSDVNDLFVVGKKASEVYVILFLKTGLVVKTANNGIEDSIKLIHRSRN